MRAILSISILLVLSSNSLLAQENLSEYEKNWPQWRGPYATGVAPAGDPPIEWNENLNIKWKSGIPGKGHSTPIIWGDQIILLSAVQTDQIVEKEEPEGDDPHSQWMQPTTTNYIQEYAVISVNRNNGEIQWQTTVHEALPHSGTHQFGSWASNSPVTDGVNIYAYFGSQGLYCLDMEGKIIWERDFGQMEKVMSFGEGSSPVLHEDKLIVLRDHQGQSFLYVLDKNTGEDIWKAEREEISSWSTPLIVESEGRSQIITAASNKVRSYDLVNGDVIWECSGLTRNVIPSPVSSNGMIYLMSGFRGSSLLAIDLSKANKDNADTIAITWKYDLNTPYTPSPVLMDGKLYFLKSNNGYLSCLDAEDGKIFYSAEKLDGIQNIFTSPVGVKDRIYIAGTNGIFYVIKNSTNFEVLSKNTLDDSFYSSPAILGNNLYLRGTKYLYCISEDQ